MSMKNALLYPQGGDARSTISGPARNAPSWGGPSMGTLASIGGTILGMGVGLPVLGTLARGIGTGLDVSRQNDQLASMGIRGRPVSFFSAFSPFGDDTQTQAMDAIENDEAGQASRDASVGLDAFGGPGRDIGGGNGGGVGSASGSGPGGSAGMGDSDGAASGTWAEGGYVPRDALVGGNPPGPDEGHIPIQSGEFVLPREAVKALGPQRLRMLQAMTQ